MKKQICFILIFVILLSLTACGEQKNAEGSAPTTVNNGPVEERESRSNVVETDPETGETYYLLADFETYYECSQVKNGGDLAFTYSLQLILSDSDDDETLTDAEIEEIAGCFEVSYQEKTEVSTIADEEKTWTVVQNKQGEDATLADILLNRIPVFSGEMKGEKEETKI